MAHTPARPDPRVPYETEVPSMKVPGKRSRQLGQPRQTRVDLQDPERSQLWDSMDAEACDTASLASATALAREPRTLSGLSSSTSKLSSERAERSSAHVTVPSPGSNVSNVSRVLSAMRLRDAESLNGVHDVTGVAIGLRNTIPSTAPNTMTDPTLFIQGVRAHQLLEMTDDSLLSPAYKRRPPTFYKIGRIFKVLWAEPAGEASSLITTLHHPEDSILGRHGERIFAKVRRFVVVREGAGYCSAVPINTYGGRGVEKAGVTKSEHAIIYTGKTIPTPRLAEMSKRGEAGMLPQPIRVDPDKPEDRLDPMSRIDFGKVHTVVHNIKAQSFGQVNRQSMDSLVHQFQEVWQHQSPTSRGTTGSTAAVSAQGAEESARVALHKLKARGYTQQEARALLLQFASERYSNRNTSGTISTTDGGKQTPQGGENESSEEAEPGDDEEEDDEEEDLYGPG